MTILGPFLVQNMNIFREFFLPFFYFLDAFETICDHFENVLGPLFDYISDLYGSKKLFSFSALHDEKT